METPEQKGEPFNLSQEQRDRVANHLDVKWKTKLCPHCGENKWTVGLYLTAMRAAAPNGIGNLNMTAPLYPFIPIACLNCGYTALVNVLAVGGILSQEGTDAS